MGIVIKVRFTFMAKLLTTFLVVVMLTTFVLATHDPENAGKDINNSADEFWSFLKTNDPFGSLVFYVFWPFWYAFCALVSSLYQWPDKPGIRTACMNGVHNELIYAFDYEYKHPVV